MTTEAPSNGRLKVDVRYFVAMVSAMAGFIAFLTVGIIAANCELRTAVLENQHTIIANQSAITNSLERVSENQARMAVVMADMETRLRNTGR